MRRDFVSVVVLVLFIVLAFGSGDDNKSPKGTSSSSTPSTSGGSSTPEPAATPGSQWSYDNSNDAMAKGTVSQASVESTNTVNFRFPYAGEQHGTLTLRTHPRYGKNVIFNIKKGQIQCPSYSGCKVLVRFDNGEATSYSAAGPEDNSSETIFINDYSGFVGKMMKAKTVRISPNVYQEGAPVFEFDVAGFDAAKYRPKK
ncbi:MAG TPA: hypothetical protein VKB93_24235 [Thermoanaerobaculia bacterium]|nr:hypothetical protein [Thermoanaerobaculia bacterium]